MLKAYSRLLGFTLLASCLFPFLAVAGNQRPTFPSLAGTAADRARELWVLGVLGLVAGLAAWGLVAAARGLLERTSRAQATALDRWTGWKADLAILLAAGVSLYLELVVIRWQGTAFEFFSFYKNIGLMACFTGLGIGYALAKADGIPLVMVLPLLAWQTGLFLQVRYRLGNKLDSLARNPFPEQINMGLKSAETLLERLSVGWLLGIAFLMTVLTFLPIGQLCGRLMEGRPKLRAYGLNLLGSVLGTGMIFLASAIWAPPYVWFGVAALGLIGFQARPGRVLAVGLVATLALEAALLAPVRGGDRVYSPYQVLEFGQGPSGGLKIMAAGYYFQSIYDLRPEAIAAAQTSGGENLKLYKDYYELPYRIFGRPAEEVVVVGAGSGNDVAAALRQGAGHVRAVEIDPAIVAIGAAMHPEDPYGDPRVQVEVTDARRFLRTTNEKFDLIVYGLLDSHTVVSHASGVRLDSFVYTVEALKEARARLKPGGMLSLSFCAQDAELAKKFFLMMKAAFDGRPPLCIFAAYDEATMFLQTEQGNVKAPKALLEETGFADISEHLASDKFYAEVSVDDWPFLYMPRRVYPMSYLIMMALVLLLSLVLVGMFFPTRPGIGDAQFFLLGVGFMLIETKGITELGLVHGNTWQVVGIVIVCILAFSFLANLLVAVFGIRNPVPAYLCILASIGAGIALKFTAGFAPTPSGRVLATIALTLPMFFAGIVFSTLLARAEHLSRAMAANILGAVCGGLAEYNAMYFGFGFLYWVALGVYGLALVASLGYRPAPAVQPSPA